MTSLGKGQRGRKTGRGFWSVPLTKTRNRDQLGCEFRGPQPLHAPFAYITPSLDAKMRLRF